MAATKVALIHAVAGLPVPAEWQPAIQGLSRDHPMQNQIPLEFDSLELVKAGPLSAAEEAVRRARQDGTKQQEPSRWFTTLDMFEIWLAIRTGDREKLQRHCRRALRWHHQAAVCGIYDLEMEALHAGLCALGETDRADELLREYVRSLRRDAFPMRASLKATYERILSGTDLTLGITQTNAQ
jgi:hypothetical protein